MDDNQYREHCLQVMGNFNEYLVKQAEPCSEGDPLRELSEAFVDLPNDPDWYDHASGLIARLFASCPDIAPLYPRELLWFFGGDCLHMMPDQEIELYQQLDELRWEASAKGELLDYHGVRANLLKLQ
jgi:hypothetical protein